jgi:putative hemolysin
MSLVIQMPIVLFWKGWHVMKRRRILFFWTTWDAPFVIAEWILLQHHFQPHQVLFWLIGIRILRASGKSISRTWMPLWIPFSGLGGNTLGWGTCASAAPYCTEAGGREDVTERGLNPKTYAPYYEHWARFLQMNCPITCSKIDRDSELQSLWETYQKNNSVPGLADHTARWGTCAVEAPYCTEDGGREEVTRREIILRPLLLIMSIGRDSYRCIARSHALTYTLMCLSKSAGAGQQCGGLDFNGPTQCVDGYTCERASHLVLGGFMDHDPTFSLCLQHNAQNLHV